MVEHITPEQARAKIAEAKDEIARWMRIRRGFESYLKKLEQIESDLNPVPPKKRNTRQTK